MNYAIIDSGYVVNIIWLYDLNASDFPNAIKLGDRPVAIGDTYVDGKFYRNEMEVFTPLEKAQQEITEYEAALSEIETALEVTP